MTYIPIPMIDNLKLLYIANLSKHNLFNHVSVGTNAYLYASLVYKSFGFIVKVTNTQLLIHSIYPQANEP